MESATLERQTEAVRHREALNHAAQGGEVGRKRAVVYRMVMPEHLCPYGLKSVDLLERKGFQVEDHWLTTRAEQDVFKAEQHVEATPQTFIGGERVGGWDDLRRYFGQSVPAPDAVSYRPVVVVFLVSALIAIAVSWTLPDAPVRATERFIAITMSILALLKLQDIEKFSTMFLGYDLLARRVVRYAYVYPYAELFAGVFMLAGVARWLSAPLALFVGTVGTVSVFKAVYVDKRSIKCACVGGSSKVPLGFVSLTENLMMIAMAIWTITYR